MNTKNLVVLALFVGIGAVLHAVVPGFIFGMKPDMMLTMMFLGIILFPDKKNVLLIGVVTGVLSGLTTQFPGGLLPNIIDKPVTAFLFFAIFLALTKYRNSIISVAVITAVGTIISGLVFLGSAFVIVGLPGPFTILFATVVLPAMAINTAAMVILYPITTGILKRANFIQQPVSQ
ncbi:tryptophan transporter [Bacillus canaveralius]|uniref:tryptophan transporter n=1 Tax=Bacillus canaveralius TaxID=1403243 RepID=UPI000F7944D6|nr:tryptophan transporter [Bacillus canaveralius]RSK43763.1 tryptophan transporter [Bacillus canaveralius]